MASLPPRYRYDRLKPGQIRLLVPRIDKEKKVVWNLRTVEIHAPDLVFDALSYVWGLETPTFPMILDDHVLPIRRNLHEALPYLANRQALSLPLWVDAICIDQANQEEIMAQIRMMSLLYQKAKTVWVWLGIAEHQARMPEAIASMEKLAGHGFKNAKTVDEMLIQRFSEKRGRNPHTSSFLAKQPDPVLPNLDHQTWSAILHLLKNPWFHRVWTVQECALASRLQFMCGEFHIDSSILESAQDQQAQLMYVQVALGYLVDSMLDSKTAFRIRRLAMSNEPTPVLLMIATLWTCKSHACAMPQDRVLGMLGLVNQQDTPNIGFDAAATTSLTELFTLLARYVLTNVDAGDRTWWDWLCLAFTLGRPENLPSWVPDLHHQGPDRRGRSRACIRASKDVHRASTKVNVIQSGPLSNSLMLRGKIVDRIIEVFPEVPTYPIPSQNGLFDDIEAMQWRVSILEWEESIAQSIFEPQKNGNGAATSTKGGSQPYQVVQNTYWRTLAAIPTQSSDEDITLEHYRDFRRVGQRLLNIIATYQRYDIFNEIVLRTAQPVPAHQPVPGPPHKARGHEREAAKQDQIWLENLPHEAKDAAFTSRLRALEMSKLFRTEQGRFGFTIKTVREGDLVSVLNSAPVAHVIRRHIVSEEEVEHDVFKFVGDAFVLGLMEQEADDMKDVEEEALVFV